MGTGLAKDGGGTAFKQLSSSLLHQIGAGLLRQVTFKAKPHPANVEGVGDAGDDEGMTASS